MTEFYEMACPKDAAASCKIDQFKVVSVLFVLSPFIHPFAPLLLSS